MAEEYISQASEKIDARVLKKLYQDFNRAESRLLGALSMLDEYLLNPEVRTCSPAVPWASRNNNSENWEPTGDRSLNDPDPEEDLSACRTGNLSESDQKRTYNTRHEFKNEGKLTN